MKAIAQCIRDSDIPQKVEAELQEEFEACKAKAKAIVTDKPLVATLAPAEQAEVAEATASAPSNEETPKTGAMSTTQENTTEHCLAVPQAPTKLAAGKIIEEFIASYRLKVENIGTQLTFIAWDTKICIDVTLNTGKSPLRR